MDRTTQIEMRYVVKAKKHSRMKRNPYFGLTSVHIRDDESLSASQLYNYRSLNLQTNIQRLCHCGSKALNPVVDQACKLNFNRGREDRDN